MLKRDLCWLWAAIAAMVGLLVWLLLQLGMQGTHAQAASARARAAVICQIMRAGVERAGLQPGTDVAMERGIEPDGAMRAAALINLDSEKSVQESPPGPPSPPPQAPTAPLALQRCVAAGMVELVLHGPRGEANGVMLGDGSQRRTDPASPPPRPPPSPRDP